MCKCADPNALLSFANLINKWKECHPTVAVIRFTASLDGLFPYSYSLILFDSCGNIG